ncbi:phosphatidylserine synthase [Cytobacillus firmus]|uniref:phospholipase D-like domain-containing protein n=1 Tax=Cytobacillus firmus TaxID=1399 RepID=UPI0018CCB47E|nr:phospholipase D-like domain-containing protein [Cytobacillus firmus]MBG9450424.1 phosphatidylserine synthase [Cytobacillus firmus]
MNEEEYLKTMVDTVKWGDYVSEANKALKDELLGVIRNSIIQFDRTGTYGTKPDHFREYIDLHVPIPLIKNAKIIEQELRDLAGYVYMKPTDTTMDYQFWDLRIKPKPVNLENQEIPEHNVAFDEIKEEIIQGIRNAKYMIWVAVAWFTDRDLANELHLRQKAGVSVRIITSDEESNHMRDDLQKHFETVLVPKVKYNRMHHKFCIIDLQYVMNGSYNWSKTAPNNNETWNTALDRELVKNYADEFMKLYQTNK